MHVHAPIAAAAVSVSAVLAVHWLCRSARQGVLLRRWSKVSLVPHDAARFMIRLATQPDAVLMGVNSLSQLKGKIEALGMPPLLPRDMHTLPASLTARARGWIRPATATFTVMQFNLLAEGLSSGPGAVPPFPAVKRGAYGGFDAVAEPELVFDWDRRKLRLLEEIFRCTPDVLVRRPPHAPHAPHVPQAPPRHPHQSRPSRHPRSPRSPRPPWTAGDLSGISAVSRLCALW